MGSHAIAWLVKQYRFVLSRMRVKEYLSEHPIYGGSEGGNNRKQWWHNPHRVEPLEGRVLLAVDVTGLVLWAEQGPGPIHGGQVAGITNKPVTGAIHSVVTRPDNAQHIWVGTVGGGIWKTENGGGTWVPKTDQFPSTSISALALDPVNSDILWAGTGVVSSSSLGGQTMGLLKSTNGGETWQVIPSVFASNNRTIRAIVPTRIPLGTGRVLFVGSDATGNGGGLLRSTNAAGTTFTRVSGSGGLPAGTVTDIKNDPGPTNADINRFYVGVPGQGVYVSTDGGANWTDVSLNIAAAGGNAANSSRIVLSVSEATAPNGNRPVYAALIEEVDGFMSAAPPANNQVLVPNTTTFERGDKIRLYYGAGNNDYELREVTGIAAVGVNLRLTLNSNLTKVYSAGDYVWRGGNRVAGIYRSDDHGATWRSMGRPGDADGGINPGAQARNHFSMLASRSNTNVVFVGGDRQALPSSPNLVGATGWTGRLFQGTHTAGGATWASITDNGANNTGPHADSRAMIFDKDNHILQVDDGGIYRLQNPTAAGRTWQSLNGNLRLGEFYSVSWDSTNNSILGGSQDNGVALQAAPGTLLWNNKVLGDGGIVHADGGTYYYSSQYFGDLEIGGTKAKLLVRTNPLSSTPLAEFDNTVQFVQPFAVNAVDSKRILIGTSWLYEGERGATGTSADHLIPLGGVSFVGGKFVRKPAATVGKVNRNAMVYGWKSGTNERADLAWVGTDGTGGNFLWMRRTGKDTALDAVASWKTKGGNARVRAIALDPTDWRHVYVLDSNGKIWFTANGDKDPKVAADWTWSNLTDETNKLASLSGAKNLQDLKVFRAGTTRVLIVGGNGGLFRRVDGVDTGHWHEYGSGPTVNGVPLAHGGGLPNALVADIQFTSNNQILVGTMGRGVFTAPTSQMGTATRVEITADNTSNWVHKLRRDASRPWLLNIYQYAAGSAEPAVPTRQLPLASIERIEMMGGFGNDQFVIDYTNGPISVPDGIGIFGSEGSNSVHIDGPGTSRGRAVHKKTTVSGIQTINTIKTTDRFGFESVQTVRWITDSIQSGPSAVALASPIDIIGTGLLGTSESLRQGTSGAMNEKRMAALDAQSLGSGLNGFRVPTLRNKDLPFTDVTAAVNPEGLAQLDNVTSILRRLLEQGVGGLYLDEIGSEDASISDLLALRNLLDNLDNTPNNVTLDTTTDVDNDGTPDTTFNVQVVNRRLDAIVNLDVQASGLFGDVSLTGALEVDTRVDLHIAFGADGSGFFLKPSQSGTSAIRLSDIKVTGDVSGSGRFGFLGVDMTKATISVDPNVAVELNLKDPGTDAADGFIRLPELFPDDFSSLIGVTVKGNPGGVDDLTLGGTFSASAILPGSDSGLGLFDANIELRWADLANPNALTVHAAPDSTGAKVLDFLKVTSQEVLDQMKALRGHLDTLSNGPLRVDLPVLKKAIDSVTNVIDTFNEKIIDPLSGGTSITASVFTIQDIVATLSGELGIPADSLHYDSNTRELSYQVIISNHLLTAGSSIDLDFSLPGGLSLNTSADASLDAQLDIDFTFGINIGGIVSGSTPIANHIFIDDVTIEVTTSVGISNFAATAKLGFVEILTSGGTGAGNGTVSLALKDPTSSSTRITLAAMADASDPFDLIVGGKPEVTGSANLSLNNIIVSGIPGLSTDPGANIKLNIADMANPTAMSVQLNGLDSLSDLSKLSFDDILAALSNVLDYLSKLEQFSFLDSKLPLVNRSVSDLLDVAQKFSTKLAQLQANPAGSLQAVEAQIEQMFSLDPAKVTLALQNKALRLDLGISETFLSTLPFNFDLASILPSSLSSLLNLNGSGNVSVDALANLQLAVGIDVTNPSNPSPFLYTQHTSTSLGVNLTATDLDFTLSLLGLAAEIKDGHAGVYAKGNTAGRASFTVNLIDSDTDNRLYFADLATLSPANVGINLDGAAHLHLPLYFPTTTLLDPPIDITIADLAALFNGDAGAVSVTHPDLSDILDGLDLSGNLSSLLSSLDQLLALLQTALNNGAFSKKIPLIGDKLKQGANVIDRFRTQLLQKLQPFINDPADKTINLVQDELFKALGPAGLNVLRDGPDEGDDINATDIGIFLDNPADPTDVRFLFHIVRAPEAITVPLGFDIGLPALGLTASGGVRVESKLDLNFGIGFKTGTGPYLYVANQDELKVDVKVSVPGLNVKGKLAFLQVDLRDDVANPSHFTAGFTADLASPDGMLTLSELTGLKLDASLDAAAVADVNLKLEVSYPAQANFPRIYADLNLDWSFGGATTSATLFGTKPNVAFNNVQLQLGSFLSNFAKPILTEVQRALGPIQPIVDFLDKDIPMLAKVSSVRKFFDKNGDKKVTIGEVIQTLDPNAVLDLIQSVAGLKRLLESIPTSVADTLRINLGNFNLNNLDLRTNPNLSTTPLANFTELNTSSQLSSQASNFAAALNDSRLGSTGAGGGKMSFPILQNPKEVFHLLMGKESDLFLWDMPRFAANLSISKSFPVLGPISIRFGGSIGLAADFTFGYDTRGLRAVAGGAPVSRLFDGFFLLDIPPASAIDPPEIVATGVISISAEVDALIVSGSVTGSLIGSLALNLNDPDNSDGTGKVRFTEIRQNLSRGLYCVFDIAGELSAELSGKIKVGVGPLSKEWSATFAKIHLLDFNHTCGPVGSNPIEDVPPDPILATDMGSGVLRLNMGPNAAQRLHGDTTDGDEAFYITNDPEVAGGIIVTAFGYQQKFTGITKITGQGGNGDDIIEIADDVNVTADLWGDFASRFLSSIGGNDQLSAGKGAATLRGGVGDDMLHGRNAADLLVGGSGNDVVHGGGGNDNIQGGPGNDSLYGEDGDDTIDGGIGDDYIVGGGGSDSLLGQAGNDTLIGDDEADEDIIGPFNDTLHGAEGDDLLQGGIGNDLIHGDAGDDAIAGEQGSDTLHGGEGADDINGGDDADQIFGNAGNDSLHGGAGNDTIEGGAGNDTIRGGDGNDSLLGQDDDDQIFGDAGNDSIQGNAGNDSVEGGAGIDSIEGGVGNDTLRGGDDDDLMYGGDGNDVMFGDAGADVMNGDAGNDSMHGGAGNDTMNGNDGNDTMHGDAGSDLMHGHAGADLMRGGDDDDVMSGDDGDDVMHGDAGADLMHGNAGNDSMHGGTGNDIMNGNDGNDTMHGDADNDLMHGHAGADLMRGGDDDDTMFGDDGDDVMYGDAGHDDMIGGAGNDTMEGNAGHDVMLGDDGIITRLLNADATPMLAPNGAPRRTAVLTNATSGGDDLMDGGAGDDSMFGGAGKDTMSGGDGDDYIEGNAGADQLSGGNGDDDMIGGSSDTAVPSAADRLDADDTMDGGTGHDVTIGDNGRITRRVGADGAYLRYVPGAIPGTGVGAENNSVIRDVTLLELDTVGAADSMTGGDGDDTMFGGLGNDRMLGNDGNDDMIGHLGADTMDGGAGSDCLVGDKGTIATDLLDGSQTKLIKSNDNMVSETVYKAGTLIRYVTLDDPTNGSADLLIGGLGNDYVHGGAGNDLIYGDDPTLPGGGDDALFGNDGNDSILAGAGNDHLWGGSGDDDLDGQAGADIVYGGDGQDRLVADRKEDKLIDWFGNFNTFVSPGPGQGAPTIIRSPNPHVRDFLLLLAAADGATDPDGEATIVAPPSPPNAGK